MVDLLRRSVQPMRSTILTFVVLPSAGLGGCGPPYIRAVKRPRPSGPDQLRSVQRSHVRGFRGGSRRLCRPFLFALLLLSAHSLRSSLCLHCSPSSGLNRTVLRLSAASAQQKRRSPAGLRRIKKGSACRSGRCSPVSLCRFFNPSGGDKLAYCLYGDISPVCFIVEIPPRPVRQLVNCSGLLFQLLEGGYKYPSLVATSRINLRL